MSLPGRYRFAFNGKENDNEVFGSQGTFQDYGMRVYDPRIGRFPSADPISSQYPMLTPYQFASNTPIQAIDLDGLEAFVVHGTTQTEGLEFPQETQAELMRITGNKIYDDQFRWNAPIYNNKSMRARSARALEEYVIQRRIHLIEQGAVSEDEPISLIGYSHGGNVAIRAAARLGRLGIRVNLVTISTPAYNTDPAGEGIFGQGSENPEAARDGINSHLHIVHENDDVIDLAGGSNRYRNDFTINREISEEEIPLSGGIESHTQLPRHEQFDDYLRNVPALPKAPGAGISIINETNN